MSIQGEKIDRYVDMINREISGYIDRKIKNYVTLVHMRSETDMVARPFTHLSLLFAPPRITVSCCFVLPLIGQHVITNKLRGIDRILPTFGE